MTLFYVRATQVRIHPLLPLLLLGAAVFGMLGEMMQALLALSLHESFHGIAAYALGYQVESVELLPFGGVARIENHAFSNRAEFVVAMAGPLCNFVVAGILAVVMLHVPAARLPLNYFLYANLSLALFNLLPALPLDGGRMLRALLSSVLRPRKATLIAAWAGLLLGGALLALAGYLVYHAVFNPFLWVMGIFLLLTALCEVKALPEAQLGAMFKRQNAFSKGESLPLRQIAVQKSTRAVDTLKLFSASRYTMIMVVDQDMALIGQLDEKRLLNGLTKYGQNITVGELLRR